MKIKANYNVLLETRDNLKEEAIKLNNEIDKMFLLLEDVKYNWTGNDSDVYLDKAKQYFNNIKQISRSVEDFANFIYYAGKTYETRDKIWKSDIEKAGVNFGDNEQKFNSQ